MRHSSAGRPQGAEPENRQLNSRRQAAMWQWPRTCLVPLELEGSKSTKVTRRKASLGISISRWVIDHTGDLIVSHWNDHQKENVDAGKRLHYFLTGSERFQPRKANYNTQWWGLSLADRPQTSILSRRGLGLLGTQELTLWRPYRDKVEEQLSD